MLSLMLAATTNTSPGDVAINEEFTCEVDTNFWSDTKFTVTITSTKGSADAGVLLHVITDTNS
jgi:hypothetical protein